MGRDIQAFYAFFSESLARRLGGPGAVVTREEIPPTSADQRTQVVIQGDHGEITILFDGTGESPESEGFISLVKEFDHIFPELRILEQPSRIREKNETFTYLISRSDGNRSWLTCGFSGQFSTRELEGIRWYVLSNESVSARLLLFQQNETDLALCLQLASSGELYRLEYLGRAEQDGEIQEFGRQNGAESNRLLYRQCGLFQREQDGVGSRCFFAGTLRFPLSLLADFLAGVTLAVELPDSIPALSCEDTVITTRIAIGREGRFFDKELITPTQETSTNFIRKEMQKNPPDLRLAE